MGLRDKLKDRKDAKQAAVAESAHAAAVAEAAANAQVVYEQLQYMALSEPTDDVPGIFLKPNEVAYLIVEGAAFVEPKRAPGQWKGRSQGTSIRVAKGVSYRVGGSKGTFQQGEERPTPTDTGTFVATSQRFIFVGSKRTTEWAYSKLIGYDTDGPGTAFFNVSNRQKTTGVMFGAVAENQVDAVIAAALAKFNGEDSHERLMGAVDSEYRYLHSVWTALSLGEAPPMRPPTPAQSDTSEAEAEPGTPSVRGRPTRETVVSFLLEAGYADSQDAEGFGVRDEGDRLKVFWLKSDQYGRDETVPEMAKGLREGGFSARVAREDGYPYVSVTG